MSPRKGCKFPYTLLYMGKYAVEVTTMSLLSGIIGRHPLHY